MTIDTRAYRQPDRVVSGSLAYWSAPRSPWWRRLLWVLPDLYSVGSRYHRWLQRQARLSDRAWMLEIAKALGKLREAEVLYYRASMLRGERGRRELEEYFSRS